MNTNDIIKLLMQQDYTEKEAIVTAQELSELSPQLEALFCQWVENGSEGDYTAEEFTLLELKKKFDMTYPAALLTIDWLLKDPQVAKVAICSGVR